MYDMNDSSFQSSRLIAIVGPTCVGKSKITQKLIESFPVEVINLDSFMIYYHFSIGTGRNDVSLYRRHLYGFLNPMENLTAEDYIRLVDTAILDISKRGNIPIFEGGSLTYLRFLNEAYKLLIVGILPENDKIIEENIEIRLDDNLSRNILEEVQEGLKLGYRNSRVLKDDVVYLPLVEFLDGKLTLDDVRLRIKNNLNKMVKNQMDGYKNFNIQWVQFNDAFHSLSNLISSYKFVKENLNTNQ